MKRDDAFGKLYADEISVQKLCVSHLFFLKGQKYESLSSNTQQDSKDIEKEEEISDHSDNEWQPEIKHPLINHTTQPLLPRPIQHSYPAKEEKIYTQSCEQSCELTKDIRGYLVGPSGPQGIQGPQGEIGPPGPMAEIPSRIGPIGPSGPRGNVGPIGSVGSQGIRGKPGPQGIPGVSGSVRLNDFLDVDISDLQDGMVLVWNATNKKWEGAQIE